MEDRLVRRDHFATQQAVNRILDRVHHAAHPIVARADNHLSKEHLLLDKEGRVVAKVEGEAEYTAQSGVLDGHGQPDDHLVI